MSSTLLGSTVGHYRIVDRLGKGGMGEVFVGYDEKLDRRVALKSIRAEHRLDAEAKARFLREARVLSQLKHPHICQIHDFVEGAEADFLVLELINGTSLTQAMKTGLDARIKFQIAEQIAAVLVAAHEKGVVHRDLKPDNVMLAEGLQVKVLDFGLSRSQEDEATLSQPLVRPDTADGDGAHAKLQPSSSGVTTMGAIMGTLGYMSPEQARGEVATAASDLYSFGLLAQELFTGRPVHEAGLDAATRLRQAQAGESLPALGLEPDLSALIGRLKAMGPGARPSAADTLEKLQWIRTKPGRRRRKALLVAGVALLAVFAAAMSVQTIRASRAEAAARKEAETSRQVAAFLEDMLSVSDPRSGKGHTVTARQLLDEASAKIQRQTDLSPEIRGRLMTTMGRVYSSMGLYDAAEPLLTTALQIREKALAPGDPDLGDSLDGLANLYRFQRKHGAAESLYRRSLTLREQALGPEHPKVSESLVNLSRVYVSQGRLAEAEPYTRRALALREQARVRDDAAVAETLVDLANIHQRQGRYADALPLHQRALILNETVLGPEHPEVGRTLNDLAIVYASQGNYAEAERLYKRAFPIRERNFAPDHPGVAQSLGNLALVLIHQGKLAESEPLLNRSLEIFRKTLGPDHPYNGRPLSTLALLRHAQGRHDEGERLFVEAVAILERAQEPRLPEIRAEQAKALRDLGLEGPAARAEARSGRAQEPSPHD